MSKSRNLICNALGISTKTTDQFLGDLKKYVIEEPNSASPNYPALINNIKNDKVKEGVDKVLDVASEFIPPIKIVKLVYSGLKIIINGTKDNQNPTTEDIAKSEAVKVFMEKVAILNNELDKEIAIFSENKKTMSKSEFSKFKKERISELRKKMEQQHNVKMSVEDQENTQSEPGA